MYSIIFSLLTDMNCWSVTMRVDHWPTVLMEIFGPKRDVVLGEWERQHTEGFMVCTAHLILFPLSNVEE